MQASLQLQQLALRGIAVLAPTTLQAKRTAGRRISVTAKDAFQQR